jgi:hypothetical protein
MNLGGLLIPIIFLALVLVIGFLVIVSLQNKQASRSSGIREPKEVASAKRQKFEETPEWLSGMKSVAETEDEPGEFEASPISEQVEEMARQLLKSHSDLGEVDLDFGTAIDGSLEIWVNSERYSAIEEIPDERIRNAISEAVDKFNR